MGKTKGFDVCNSCKMPNLIILIKVYLRNRKIAGLNFIVSTKRGFRIKKGFTELFKTFPSASDRSDFLISRSISYRNS